MNAGAYDSMMSKVMTKVIAQRFLRNPYLWLTLLLTGLYGWLGYLSYRIIGNNLILEMADYAKEHNMPTLEATWPQVNEAYWSVTKLAFPTLGFFLVFFVLIDRLRPTSLLKKTIDDKSSTRHNHDYST